MHYSTYHHLRLYYNLNQSKNNVLFHKVTIFVYLLSSIGPVVFFLYPCHIIWHHQAFPYIHYFTNLSSNFLTIKQLLLPFLLLLFTTLSITVFVLFCFVSCIMQHTTICDFVLNLHQQRRKVSTGTSIISTPLLHLPVLPFLSQFPSITFKFRS